jgi:ABC-type lipoprotein release transport system permease subunit
MRDQIKMLFKIAFLNLFRDYRRSVILTGAIIVGVAGLAFFQMVNEGFIQMMVGTIVNSSMGHMEIHNKDYSLELDATKTLNLGSTLKDVLANTPLIESYTPRVVTNCLISSSQGSYPTLMFGVYSKKEITVTDIGKRLSFGKLPEPEDVRSVAIGRAMARQLKVVPGDKVVIMTKNLSQDMESGSFIVKGIFTGQSSQSEKSQVYLSIRGAQRLLGMDESKGTYHEIAIKLTDFNRWPEASAILKDKIKDEAVFGPLKASDWSELQPVLGGQVEMVWVSTLIMFTIVFIALSFGIFNSFMIEIFERTKEFGILMAVGTRRYTVFLLLLVEALIIGTAGGIGGLLLAWFGCSIILGGILDLTYWGNAMAHFNLASSIPLVLTGDMIHLSLWATITITVAATIYPAVRAATFRPLARAMRM